MLKLSAPILAVALLGCGYDGAILPPQLPMQSAPRVEDSGMFEVQCRFGISACESQAAEWCKHEGVQK
jgi:hypothetical protein